MPADRQLVNKGSQNRGCLSDCRQPAGSLGSGFVFLVPCMHHVRPLTYSVLRCCVVLCYTAVLCYRPLVWLSTSRPPLHASFTSTDCLTAALLCCVVLHCCVVLQAPGMVVHLSPGHTTGTLVNALLAHCGLPACSAVPCGSAGSNSSTSSSSGLGLMPTGQQSGIILGGMVDEDDFDEAEDDESPLLTLFDQQQLSTPGSTAAASTTGSGSGNGSATFTTTSTTTTSSSKGIIRPGIVHRLDRGTSGLMVVAKTDAAHAALCQQFKERSVSRIYNSITVGAPQPAAARVATNIVRWARGT